MDNVKVHLNYELHNATNGALIPLKNSTTNFVHAVPSYTAGTPKSVAALGVSDTLLLEPVGQLESVSNAYYVVVNLSVDEGPGPPYLAGNALLSPANQLLHFDGNLFFGSIPTYFTAIGNAPTPGPRAEAALIRNWPLPTTPAPSLPIRPTIMATARR